MNDPAVSIKDLLKDNWDDDNTSSITPTFSTGWFDQAATRPMVTLTDAAPIPQSSGPVPFFGLVSNGSPNQYFLASLALNVWTSRKSSTVNPKQLRFEFVEEIQRILLANYEEISDLDFVAWGGGHDDVDAITKPPVFRFIAEVRYGYLKTS